MTNKVLVIGAAVIDHIIEIESLPKSGEDVYGEKIDTVVGGSGYNVQRILAKFNVEVDFLCPIGVGSFAELIKDNFKERNIPLSLVDRKMDNGWNISFVEADGERTFLTVPGIEVHWHPNWFKSIDLNDYTFIYVSGYELEGNSGEIIVQELEKIRDLLKTKIVFDPSPRISYLKKGLLERLFALKPIIHCNQEELVALTNGKEIRKNVEKLHRLTQTEIVVTLGGEGAALFNGRKLSFLKSEEVHVVDTIGAGDSHTAAYITGKIKGMTSYQACGLANKVAGEIVSRTSGNFEDLDVSTLLKKSSPY